MNHEKPFRGKDFREWAHLDLNQGPHPYQGCALTGLSYGPSKPLICKGLRLF